jgi:hypothetical protein
MTTNLKPKRLVLTSATQVIMLTRSNPQLPASIPKLASLLPSQPVEIQPTFLEPAKKSCNCGARKIMAGAEPSKSVVEGVLSSLESADFLQIKNILMLDQLCYYKRNTELDKLELTCI